MSEIQFSLTFRLQCISFDRTFSLAGSSTAVNMAAPEQLALEEALKKGSSDLKFTLTRNEVSDELQAAFYRNGVTTIPKFFILSFRG